MRKNNSLRILSPLAGNGGFTLTEFLIATVVLTIALLGVAGFFQNVTRSNTSSRQVATATSIAQQELEEIKRKGFNRFTTAVSKTVSGYQVTAGANHIRRLSVSPFQKVYSSPIRDTMTVNISVTGGTPPHSVTLQTILAK